MTVFYQSLHYTLHTASPILRRGLLCRVNFEIQYFEYYQECCIIICRRPALDVRFSYSDDPAEGLGAILVSLHDPGGSRVCGARGDRGGIFRLELFGVLPGETRNQYQKYFKLYISVSPLLRKKHEIIDFMKHFKIKYRYILSLLKE